MKTIALINGGEALVDDEDFDRLNFYQWHNNKGYAYRHEYRKGKKKGIFMHREIMRPPDSLEVDHKYGNTLDNRKANLRLCTHRENMQNQKKVAGCSSRYKGVTWHKQMSKWMARIYCNYKPIQLGYFDSEVEAARKYNEAALSLYGAFARLNIIEPAQGIVQ